jgi:23S rRNA (adenine2503-C2)-methyltransferase
MHDLALQAVTPERLVSLVPTLDLSEARKIVSDVHGERDFRAPRSDVRRKSREAIVAVGHVPSLETVSVLASAVDPFLKLALRTSSGHVIEAVRIPLEKPGRYSVCVSSQAGCALACAFCATGRLGLLRNLDTWEIVEQVRAVRRTLRELPQSNDHQNRISGVVFQGMGEPLANLDRVLESVAVFCEPSAQAIDARNITVCTAGLPSGIRRLADVAPRVRLGLSIGSARPEVRERIMPITKSFGLDEVVDAAAYHADKTGLSPMFAVTLLAGVNDSDEDAVALADLVLAFGTRTSHRPRLSVIPYNAIALANDPFMRTTQSEEDRFVATLRARGVHAHRRYSGGGDIAAACGQLAGGSALSAGAAKVRSRLRQFA